MKCYTVLWKLRMADLNNVQIKYWFINFVNIKFNMYLCIFTAAVITVYKYDKQKTIAY